MGRRQIVKWLFQLSLLTGLTVLIWYVIHLPPRVSADVYPFLTSLRPQLILDSQNKGNGISPNTWVDLLAIEVSLQDGKANYQIQQLNDKIPYSKLNWGSVESETVKLITRRREILINYPYYQPHKYMFPVIGKTWFTNTYGADREGGKRKHEGTDLFSLEGTPLVSVCAGKVEQLGWNRLGGERVGIRGDDGNYYYYAHLQKIAPSLTVGQKIARGVYIGNIGHTGDALTTPDHLHFGIELSNGRWINPFPFLVIWQHYTGRNISIPNENS